MRVHPAAYAADAYVWRLWRLRRRLLKSCADWSPERFARQRKNPREEPGQRNWTVCRHGWIAASPGRSEPGCPSAGEHGSDLAASSGNGPTHLMLTWYGGGICFPAGRNWDGFPLLAAYLSAHRTMINGSALCAALAVTERY
jgi:hypothetical protein